MPENQRQNGNIPPNVVINNTMMKIPVATFRNHARKMGNVAPQNFVWENNYFGKNNFHGPLQTYFQVPQAPNLFLQNLQIFQNHFLDYCHFRQNSF